MAAIVTPTIRTPLLAGEGGSAGRSPVRTSPAPTTKDWWMYWDTLTRAANQNTAEIAAIEELIAAAVRIGTHDERLAVDPAPIGALWMESDRDNVIYQAQTVADEPQWVYISGTMVAAFASRPVDLGANDAGFRFEASDTQQFFRWDGASWVDQTPGSVVVVANASASLTLTTTFQTIAGTSITLPRAGRYLIQATFDLIGIGAGDTGANLTGQLLVNGVAQPAQGNFRAEFTAAARATVTQQWVYQAVTAGQTAVLQAAKSSGTGTSIAGNPHTCISALWVNP